MTGLSYQTQLGSTPLEYPQAIPGCWSIAPILGTLRQEYTAEFGRSLVPGWLWGQGVFSEAVSMTVCHWVICAGLEILSFDGLL